MTRAYEYWKWLLGYYLESLTQDDYKIQVVNY